MNDLKDTVRTSSIYIIISKLLGPLITLFITAYIIRKLSVNDYGAYNIFLAIMAYIGLVSSLGLLNIFQRFVPDFYEKKWFSSLKTLVYQGLLFRFFCAVLLVILVLIFSDKIERIFKLDNYFHYFQIFAIGIIFFLESQLIGLALTSTFLHKYF